MATYTVGPSGCDQTTIQAALNAYTTAGDIIEVHGGTYAEKLVSATANGITLRCKSGDTCVIDGSGQADHTVLLSHAGMTFSGFKIIGSSTVGAYYGLRLTALATSISNIEVDGGQRGFYDSASNTVSNLTVKNTTATGAAIFTNASSTTLYNPVIRSNAGPVYIAGSGTLTLYNGDVRDNTITTGVITTESGTRLNYYYGVYSGNASGIVLNNTGTNNIYNLVAVGNAKQVVYTASSTPTVNVTNLSAFSNGTSAAGSYYVVDRAAGTVTVTTSLILPNLSPLVLASPAANYSLSAGVVDGGGNIYALPLVRSGRRPAIVVFGTDDATNISYSNDTVAQRLEQYGWRGTYSIDTDGMNAGKWATAVSLVAAGHEIASHSKSHVDLTSLGAEDLATELSASKTAIETNIPGYTCSTIVPPYNETNATVEAAILAAGYVGARGSAALMTSILMENINIFDIGVRGLYALYGNDDDPSEATVKANLGGILEGLKYKGGILFLYAHNATELTADGWDKTLALVAKSGVMVKTMGEAIAYIKAHGTDSGDHLTYTRTFTDASDYRPRLGSPAINAGVDVGLTTDYLGKPIRGLPDIGCYEFQPMSGNFAFTFGIGF